MSADIKTIRKFLVHPDLSTSERWVVMWQFRILGDFGSALAKAITLADESNLNRLAAGFPVEVQGYREWSQGGLGRKLRDMGLDI